MNSLPQREQSCAREVGKLDFCRLLVQTDRRDMQEANVASIEGLMCFERLSKAGSVFLWLLNSSPDT